MALLDLHPTTSFRPWLREGEVTGPISPRDLEGRPLEAHPCCPGRVRHLPTYYGVCSDLPALAQGLPLPTGCCSLVEPGAHGAHLPFWRDRSLATADVAVGSLGPQDPARSRAVRPPLLSSRFSPGRAAPGGLPLRQLLPLLPPMMAAPWMPPGLDGGRRARALSGAPADRWPACAAASPLLTPGAGPLDPTRLVLQCADGLLLPRRPWKPGVYPPR